MGWDSAFMAVKSKAKTKRVTLPFVAPEVHYATKADVANVETKLSKQISNVETQVAQLETKLTKSVSDLDTKLTNTKAQIIMWVAGLQLASIGIIIAVLK